MRVHLQDTFLASLARLDGRAAAAVKRAAFDLLASAARPGLRLHRLVHAVDHGFWSLRVNRDLRIIVHREGPDLALCYTDHHDRAYAWAAQRTLDDASPAGALELVQPARVAPPPAPAPRAVPPAPAPPSPHQASDGSPRRRRAWRRAVAPLEPPRPPGPGPRRGNPPAPLLALLRLLGEAEPRPGSPHLPPHARAVEARASPGARPGWPLSVAVTALGSALAVVAALLAGADPTSGAMEAALVVAPGLVPLGVAAGLHGLRARALRRAGAELERLAGTLRAGHLQARCDAAALDVGLRPLLARVDAAIEAAAAPGAALGAALSTLARGDAPALPAPLPDALGAERAALARLTRFLQLGPAEIRALAGAGRRELGPARSAPRPR